MQIPLSWIKEYLPLEKTPQEIADMLTMAGLEVDAILEIPPPCKGVVVTKVTHKELHPNADNLCLATVFDGKEETRVVCGAPNCKEGLITAFAPVGVTLQDEKGKKFRIKEAKIRGETSFGMLCSGVELQISDDQEGILDLPEESELGVDISNLFAETVFEISLTPNLAHCASVLGIIRELSAASNRPFDEMNVSLAEESNGVIKDTVSVDVQDKNRCPRYACRLIRGVKVGPSPIWLQRKLEACGQRPVNNIVDITNFVLLERGHPLHAFDLKNVHDGKIIVRCSKQGEELSTLDGEHRKIPENTLLITDSKGPLAIAGVIGGLHSEVKDTTVDILLESAYFEPVGIRKTSKALSLQTDASKRFERGCDPKNVDVALNRAASLISEIAGGEVVSGIIDQKEGDFPEKVLTCRVSRINHFLGAHLSASEIEDVFRRLQFVGEWKDGNTYSVTIPTYRVDLHQEVDLIEEVARIVGYEHFFQSDLKSSPSSLEHAPIFLFERKARSHLLREGLQELLTSDLISPAAISLVKGEVSEEAILKVLNPTSSEQSVLRPSLMPGLLQVVKFNQDRQEKELIGFEVGRIHLKEGAQFKEQSIAGIILVGGSRHSHWERKVELVDFYDIKGMVENLLDSIGCKKVKFESSSHHSLHPGQQASVVVDGAVVGSIGQVHPKVTHSLGITRPVFYAECNLHDLIQFRSSDERMESLPQFPSSTRDATLTLSEKIPVTQIFQAIDQMDIPILENSVEMIDLYRSEQLGEGKQSITFRFVYRDLNKTVTQEEVDQAHSKVIESLLHQFGKSAV